jgi:flagellar L-ring protein precursor FlgH
MTTRPTFQKILAGALVALSLSGTVRAGSLWVTEANNEQGMFADRRARNVGDLLTIVVDESTVTTSAQEIKTFTAAQGGAGTFVTGLLNQFLGAGVQAAKIASGASTASTNSAASAWSGVTIPTLDLAAKSDFTGGGSTTTRLTAANRTAVTVVDVLPNGNLVVEGAKIIRANKVTQYGYMRGIVRQFDVQRDNTVLSSNIADAQVEFVPSGELTDAEKQGWLLRAWNKVKPIL